MSDKKTLLTGDVKDFIEVVNNKTEAKRKSSPRQRSVKAHHKTGR